MGRKVLVVDLDPQGNATAGLGIDRYSHDVTMYEVLFDGRSMADSVLESDSGVFVSPSSLDLLAAETHMTGKINSTAMLRTSLEEVRGLFDHILIDVPPASTLLMMNGIVAAENIIVPLDSGVFAFETMETLKTLVIDLQEELGIETNVMMMLLRECSPSVFDKGPTREIRGMLEDYVRRNISSPVRIFTVPFSARVYRSQMRGMPLSHIAPFSGIARIYKRIAKTIIETRQ